MSEHHMGSVIEHLKETFMKYLEPKVIIEAFISNGKLKETEFNQNEVDREKLVQLFLDWLLEHDESEQLVEQFISFLKNLSKESIFIGSTHKGNGPERPASKYLPDVVNMIDGTLIKALNREDLDYILNKMINYKLILEQSAKHCHKTGSDYEFCLELFRSVKARKPDWPLNFIDIVETRKPEILFIYSHPNCISGSELKVMNTSTISEYSSSTKSDENRHNFDDSDHSISTATSHSFAPRNNTYTSLQLEVLNTSTTSGSSSASDDEKTMAKSIFAGKHTEINDSQFKVMNPSSGESLSSRNNAEDDSSCRSFNHYSEHFLPSSSSTAASDKNLSADNEATTKNFDIEMTNAGIPRLTYAGIEDYIPRKSQGPASVAQSDFSIPDSELSHDYSEAKSHERDQRVVSEQERNTKEMKVLLKEKVIDEKFLKVVKDDERLSQSLGTSASPHNSDSEEDDLDDSEMLRAGVKKIKSATEAPPLSLRQYQIELAEKAVQGLNTVICAPTGSGKTRVATHIILEHLKQNKKKTVAFLTRTIPLTVQQYKVLNKALPAHYSITHITGQSQDSLELRTFVKRNNVIVLTPMILVNHLRKKSVRLRNFSLLIFDECHHTRKDEPYNLLMFMYLKAKLKGTEKMRSNLPQIVGLSASIGIDRARNVKEAADNILKICGNLDAPHLSTVQKHKEELIQLVPVPQEFDFQLKERDANDALNKVMDVMSKLEKHAEYASTDLNDSEIKSLVGNPPRNKKSQDYGKWAVELKSAAKSVPIDDKIRETKEPVRTLMIIADYLWTYNVAMETHDLVELTDVMGYLKRRFERFSKKKQRTDKEDIFYTYFLDLLDLVKRRNDEENQNLGILAQILMKNIVEKGKDSRGIIFVRTRALAEALSAWLNRCGIPELQELKASIFTGTNAKADEGGMSQAQQEDTIREFRAGKIKVLVATSVAEEGLDIPDCNLVVKYNHVGNEITTVQTKGRSRKREGVAYLLGMDNILRKEYVNREKEKLMKKAFGKIDEMSLEEKEAFIKKYQTEVFQQAEIDEALASKRKKLYKDLDYTMVCSLCRKVSIERKNIRLIFDKFRVSIDRELLKGEFLECIPRRSQYIDEMELIGPVFCKGQPRPGVLCGHKLGTMVKYGGLHYFAIGIKKFAFYKSNQEKLEHYKMWKNVPYFVEDLSTDDIRKYADIPEDNETTGILEDETDSSDDEDSKPNNIPLVAQSRHSNEEESSIIAEDITAHTDLISGDERNSVTHNDIQQYKMLPVTGSLAKKVDSELGKAPSLTSNMEEEIKTEKEPSISVACSESGSEDSRDY